MSFLKSYFVSRLDSKQPNDPEKGHSGIPTPTALTHRRDSAESGLAKRASFFPDGDFRNSGALQILEIKYEVMANWLYTQQVENFWGAGEAWEGVVLKKARNQYTCCPTELKDERGGLFDAVQGLNVRCAMTVNTGVIKLFLGQPELISIPLLDNLKIQIIPDISYLPRCQKHHFAAFIRDRATVVVWDDDPRTILDRIRYLEQQLVAAVWKEGSAASDEKKLQTPQYLNGENSEDSSDVTPEGGRKTILIQSWLAALTLFLVISAIGLGFRSIATEIKVDHQWRRLALLAVVLVQVWLALFFMQSLIGCLAQLLGPTSQLTSNSKYYSGKAPRRLRSGKLPHVSIQCPVYKEGLDSVIGPTITSVKAAISTYEMQGGSASIFINDDGMQLISHKDALARQEYYEEHNIGWIARPRHNPKPTDGSTPFIRPGKFKKASNMNYALDISIRIEDKLNTFPRPVDWNVEDEEHSYATAFLQVIEEDEGRTWGAGNIRVGDYILLIDSDTRVPTDCLLDIVSEMEVSPEVAIIQYASGVMNVTDSFFERGITFFTHLVYTAIRFAVGNGDVAPFVGHNAILRWSAIQDVAYTGGDGDRYWSESTVSEDFDMALRLQCAGYIVRLAAYTGTEDGFKEGVSLTVYDELARWEKYAYGCSELIFHPLKSWVFRGPFTPLFRKFIFSMMPLPSKLTIMAYVGTYYALASAFPLTLANYLIVGWFNTYLDHYYLDSFKIYFAIIIVFTGLGNIALAVLRYRMGERSLFGALLENFSWVPLLTIFLGGLSLHLLQAILSHLFSVEMGWGATAKEATETSFFEELPKLVRNFKWTFVICFATMAGMIILSTELLPYQWRIGFFTAVWPLATVVASHVLLPTVLNPGLMLFTW